MPSLLRRKKKDPTPTRTTSFTPKRPDLAKITKRFANTSIGDWTAMDTETTGLSIPHGSRPFLFSAWSFNEDDPLSYTLDNDNDLLEYDGELPGSGVLYWGKVNWSNRKVKWSSEELDELAQFLTGRNLVGFNMGFDLRMLASIGIIINSIPLKYQVSLPDHYFGAASPPRETRVVEVGLLADVQIGVHVFDNRGPSSLDDVTRYYLGMLNEDDKKLGSFVRELRRKIKKEDGGDDVAYGRNVDGSDAAKADYWMVFQDAPSEDPSENLCSEYALRDVYRTLSAWDYCIDSIEEDGLWDQCARQHLVFPAFVQLPTQGIPLHEENLASQLEHWTEATDAARVKVEKILKAAGHKKPNAGSTQQVGEYLYGTLKLPVLKKTATQKPCVDGETRKALLEEDIPQKARDFLELYNEFTSTSKTRGMVEGYQKRALRCKSDGVLYLFGDFKQTGTALTRCSSDNPNLQNIPKRTNSLRNIIGAPPGWKLVSIDYSQIEIRLFVKASGDPEMGAALADGLDVHTFTASEVFSIPYDKVDPKGKERSGCKNVNFGIIYGAGEAKVIRTIGNAKAWSMYQKKFPSVPKYMAKMIAIAEQKGEIRTLFGYRIWVAPEPTYVAVNCVVQGSAGDAMKEAMTILHYQGPSEVRTITQVHDELLFLIPDNRKWAKTAKQLQRLMESAGDAIDCELPADPEYHPEHWGAGEALPSV